MGILGAVLVLAATFQTAVVSNLYSDAVVVTNVDFSGAGVSTNDVCAIVTNNVASWAMAGNAKPVTDLAPAYAYTTAVSNKIENEFGSYMPLTGGTVGSNFKIYSSNDGKDVIYRRNTTGNADKWVFAGMANSVPSLKYGYSGNISYKDNSTIRFDENSLSAYQTSYLEIDGSPVVTSNMLATVGGATYAAKATEDTVSQWENYWSGDKVRLSVTNYYGNTSGELPRLRIEEAYTVTNADHTTSNVFKIVWDEEARHTNYQAQVDAKVAAISNATMTAAFMQTANQLAGKAPKAWQSVASDGGAAPANTVWMSAPNTVFAGGTTYAHVSVGEGSICVLANSGQSVYTEGEEGTFRFRTDDGANYFGFDMRKSYTIGCRTDGISVLSGNIVSLTYDLTTSETVHIMTCTNLLTGTWSEATVEWEENPPANTKICYINVGAQPQGFYKAEISYQGTTKFVTNTQAEFAGGILATNMTGVGTSDFVKIFPEATTSGVVWRVEY